MALPTQRFRVSATLLRLGTKAGRDCEQVDHPQRLRREPQDKPRDDQLKDNRRTDDGSKPGMGSPRPVMTRAEVERAHPPRVYRLEGATWCEVKFLGKKVD
jgi:hypothetical protein